MTWLMPGFSFVRPPFVRRGIPALAILAVILITLPTSCKSKSSLVEVTKLQHDSLTISFLRSLSLKDTFLFCSVSADTSAAHTLPYTLTPYAAIVRHAVAHGGDTLTRDAHLRLVSREARAAIPKSYISKARFVLTVVFFLVLASIFLVLVKRL